MARVFTCDVCRKKTNEIVAKLFFTPLTPGRSANGASNNYTHHLDVGACCNSRLLELFPWTERQTAAEYAKSRRKTTVKR